MLRGIPRGALLLIIAGSPCQDLTVAGRYRGRLGIAGPQSVLFYAVPVVARAVSEIRPDIVVHVLLENAGTTQARHRHAMGRALGMDPVMTDRHSVVADAAAWAHLPRRRLLLSTLGRDEQPWVPPRRPAPWDRGWRPHWHGALTPLTRARHQNGDFIRGSTFQYVAPALLYHDDGPWQGMDMAAVRTRIGQLMPPELRRAWLVLHRSPRGEEEREAERAAEWVGRFGQQHGFRPPNLGERSRAMGSASYLDSQGLCPRALCDAQSNHFDRHVIPLRVSRPVVCWLQGEDVPRHSYPAVADIEADYQELRVLIEREGLPAQAEGVPRDVQAAARLGWRNNTAAEHGRREQ